MNYYEQNYNLLAIRPGEEWELRREPPTAADHERVYIVALVETPDFPFATTQGVHQECRQQVVIAAEVYPTVKSNMRPRIGWVILEPDTKAIIGNNLESQQAKPGEWFFLILDTRKYPQAQTTIQSVQDALERYGFTDQEGEAYGMFDPEEE